MLRDVFYYGNKPNVHPRERFAESLEDAREKCTTEHFWIINEFCDYRGFDWDFDFEFLPNEDVWAEEHNNVWPSQHQKDSGTWLCPKEPGEVIIYRSDVDPVVRKNEKNDNWVLLDNIDEYKFDFSWHPDPTDPPYIYRWGSKFAPVQLKPVLEYHTPNATEVKYMATTVELTIERDKWVFYQQPDPNKFDFTWRPNPLDPPYIYVWGNKHIDGTLKPTVEYHVPGATDKKYMPEKLEVLPEWDRWEILHDVDKSSFDFSWRPDPREPNLNYVFGNDQYDSTIMPTLIYKMEGATDEKHMPSNTKLLPQKQNFEFLENSDGIDYSWVPNPTAPPYIYAWGNQWNKAEDKISIQYVVEGATEYQYMDERAIRKFCMDNWIIPDNVDTTGFDFSWEPNPNDPPYIYEFATQWQKTGGPRYVVEGATETKYMDFQKAKKLVDMTNWTIPKNVDVSNFDFSWHPDATSPPYIYNFPTQWALSGGPTYTVPNATEVKYVDDQSAKAIPNKDNWDFDPTLIDENSFDFSWHPYAEDEPYIYQFGTQWQKTGGPRYITPGVHKNSPVSYVDTRVLKAKRLPNQKNWAVLDNLVIIDFDYSWHPDETEEPYIYQFGNNLYPAEIMPTVEYSVPKAKQVKYVSDIIATLGQDRTNWEIPDNVDITGFDFSWKPNPKDPPYIYEFATQWQKTGGPKYIVEGATETKYIDTCKVKRLPSEENWTVPTNIDITDFDFSWHPDATSPPYIYNFATQWALSGGPVYTVPGATEIKYVEDQTARALPDKTNWQYDSNLIDENSFDFSWHPYVEDQPYIYIFGTQWQKTGGPKYITPGCHKNSPVKYIDTRIIKAKRLPSMNHWNMIYDIDMSSFDFSWHPDDTDDPFIYQFGNTQYPAEEMPTVEYCVEGAKKFKYVSDVVAKLAPNTDNWIIPKGIDTTEFDFSWHPHPKDPPYIYEFATQWQKTGGPQYKVYGATEVKYVSEPKAKKLPNMKNWVVPDNIDVDGFDFSWHPDDTAPPYMYQFPTQWALTGGPVYVVPNATIKKYEECQTARVLPSTKNWEYDATQIDVSSFDFSWHPYAEDDPFIYQFGTQWQKTGGPKYITPGTTADSPVKYVDTRIIKAKRLPNKDNFVVLPGFNIKEFDYSWHPDDTEPAYTYVFGNEWHSAEREPTLEYRVINSTDKKYINNVFAKLTPDMSLWDIPDNVDISKFDFSWHPDPHSPPYIYEFATVWQNRGGPKYKTPGATEVKYIEDIKAPLVPSKKNWLIPENVDVSTFDFSWVPHPLAPPYIYQFGTILDEKDGPRYLTPGNNGEIVYLDRIEVDPATLVEVKIGQYFIDTTLEDLVKKHPDEIFWAMQKNIDYSTFDFAWRPEVINIAWESDYVNVFGSPDSEVTQTYFVNAKSYLKGKTDFKFIEETAIDDKSLAKLFKKPDMFYVDKGNKESSARFELLKAKFPHIQKTRYLNSWVDTINRCTNRATTPLLWILNSELDYSNFDFEYYPNPWQMKMVHVFGTQWSHWGTTFMVNRETFSNDTKYIKIIEHLSNLNFVKTNRAVATQCLYDIVLIDHGNINNVIELLQQKAGDKSVSVVKYDTSYLNTIRTVLSKQPDKRENYIWLCSSICDYTNFDFSYVCDPFAREQLHVFPSGKQKFGDTFFLDVNKAKELIKEIDSLEEYNKVNYNASLRVPRMPEPIIVTSDDTLVDAAKRIEGYPYAVLMTEDNKNIDVIDTEPMNLWSPETKTIMVTSTGASRIIVPRDVKDHVKTELYDYPYIKKSTKLAMSKPLDIVFLSNGETGADENYEHLLKVTKGIKNRVVRVDGVNGRAAAYHAAVEASETPWAFTVFAKLKVSAKFDWNWQPDRMQIPKHYIFQTKNPVNGLVYGHQAMIAYNKKLTLANEGKGLDFTLDDPHEVVQLLSGTAVYNTDAFSTWRTAFREVLKLRAEDSDIARERLHAWLNKAEGDFAQYSIKGAVDADEYYDEVNGDFDKIKLSYEWAWLRNMFDMS